MKPRKKPALSTPFHEAVAILSSWSAKVGATEVVAKVVGQSPVLHAMKGTEVVGVLRWNDVRKWHVTVGMGSWSVLPKSTGWTRESLDNDCRTAAKYYNRFPVDPLLPVKSSEVDRDQEVLHV